MRSIYILFLLALPTLASLSYQPANASLDSGRQVFQASCTSCHGEGNFLKNVPILFGQEPSYIKYSLELFRSGERQDHIMGMMNSRAEDLSSEEIHNVSLYLASQDICQAKHNIDVEEPGFLDQFKAGRALAKEKNCMHCHESFHHRAPKILGQNKEFISLSLKAFRDGHRESRFMKRFTADLTDDDIDKLSTYFNGMILMRHCD